MPIKKLLELTSVGKPLTSDEGRRILERDKYRCQYCGLDGAAAFEDSLIMTVDFIHPRAKRGKKAASNLVAACRPCNLIKGYKMFGSFEEAKDYVLQKRLELREEWQSEMAKLGSTRSAEASSR
jgi:5-methylcytosine-specific restriction endonuclease McrA